MTPTEALQETLAAEHAAVYAYGVLGGRVSVSEAPAAAAALRAAYDVHRARRDQLRNRLSRLGETPVPPRVAYRVDADDRSAGALLDTARALEERCAAVYAQLVANSTRQVRAWAVEALVESARRAGSLGAAPTAFPGLPELG